MQYKRIWFGFESIHTRFHTTEHLGSRVYVRVSIPLVVWVREYTYEFPYHWTLGFERIRTHFHTIESVV